MLLKSKAKISALAAVFFTAACTILYAADFPYLGKLNSDKVNVRVDSTVASAVICTLDKADAVEVVSELYDWCRIRLPKKAPSYAKQNLLECFKFEDVKNTPSAAGPVTGRFPPKCVSAIAISDHVNVRSAPSESAWILGKLDKGVIVNLLGENSGWYKIEPIHDSFAWVNKKFITRSQDKAAVQPPAPDSIAAKLIKPQGKNDQLLVVSGVVKPYGVVLWRKATHKLITEGKVTYLSKGNKKGLDALCNSKVRVSGRLIQAQAKEYPVIEVAVVEGIN